MIDRTITIGRPYKYPLPKCDLAVRCNNCRRVIARFDTNTGQLASRVMETRREHATQVHGWTPETR